MLLQIKQGALKKLWVRLKVDQTSTPHESSLFLGEYQTSTPESFLSLSAPLHRKHDFRNSIQIEEIEGERGRTEWKGEGGGSLGELGEGPGVADLQRWWGFPEQC